MYDMKIGRLLGLTFFLLFSSLAIAIDPAQYPKLKSFVDELVQKHNFDKKELNRLFADVELKHEVVKAMKRPAEKLPWYRYKKLFVFEEQATKGAKFWKQYERALARSSAKYGVPPEVIVAIIGVESRYGESLGKHRIIDSLTTLMLLYPRRSDFFRREIKEFLLLAREEGLDPLTVKGSYAGAMGVPQFIASSYRQYAVDFNNDNKRDLISQPVDAIGSIGHYLKKHKWKRDGPIASDVKLLSNASPEKVVTKGFKTGTSVAQLRKHGVKLTPAVSKDTAVGLVALDEKQGKLYRVGFNNFYVITRYNRSALYAMVVYELSQKIAKTYSAGTKS